MIFLMINNNDIYWQFFYILIIMMKYVNTESMNL